MVKRKQGKLPEAEACLDECEKLELAVSKTSHSQSMALSLLERGLAMRQGGNLERARDCLDKSSITQLNLTANTARLEEALQKQWLSSTLYARGKWLKAKDMLPESREIYHPGHEPWAPLTCEIPREICWIDQWLDLDFLQQEYPREADVRQDLGATSWQHSTKNPSGTVVSHFLRCQRSSHEYLVHTSQWAEMMSALRMIWHFLERVFQRPGAVAAYTTIGWGGHVSPVDFKKNCRLMKSQSKEHLSICFILDDTRPTKSRKSRPF